MTDANLPGVEKVVITGMKSAWKTSPRMDFSDFKLSDVAPDAFFMVKGWNRAVCALAVLWACYEHEGMYEAWYQSIFARLSPALALEGSSC